MMKRAELEKQNKKFGVIVANLPDPLKGGPCYKLHTKSFYEQGIFVTQVSLSLAGPSLNFVSIFRYNIKICIKELHSIWFFNAGWSSRNSHPQGSLHINIVLIQHCKTGLQVWFSWFILMTTTSNSFQWLYLLLERGNC